ncbi:MAG: restriction endonuclease subunit S [Nostoc sp. DedQUE12b]|uniref:restriction endonuclease subunit S n=1 Tax=Nostoc sp. DedQUE12b TaxID=3075398 RepID=UPI002AD2CAA7|nr:restriction endonuclease subunit S [Nostoc sp. DedQUE12b]MDZ8088404.1 restriction endonuclease subunit S [Nostoc sp. DedQUE12b]
MVNQLDDNREFKDSPLGMIPKDWDVKFLGDCAFITKLAGFEYTNYFNNYSQTGEIIALRVLNLRNGKLELTNIQTIPKSTSKKLPRSALHKNDLVISYVGTIGEVALIEEDDRFHLAPNVAKISPNQQIILSKFLFIQILSETTQKKLIYLSTTTSQPALSMSRLRQLPIILPPFSEQKQIAKILDTVNKAIAQTETLIAKYKRVKTGLMQDLLTRGIDEHGQLRDPRTHKFKRSPLGMIPDEWDVVTLSNEIDIVHGHGFKGEYFSDQPPGTILLVPGNFYREGGIYFDNRNTKFYQGLIPEWTILNNGDILIVMTDLSPQTLILGRVIQIDLPFKVLHNQRIGKIIIKLPETWNNRFLMAVMNSTRVRNGIINNATGTTVKHTSPERIIANIVPKPCIREQKQILTILDKQEELISSEQTNLTKLQKIKTGLMQDLLTGKTSVKPLLTNQP